MLGSQAYPPTAATCSQLKLDSPGSDGEELFLAELLPPECMEFGTQTLDSALEDIASLDFGVQTLLPSDTKDQSSQTLS